MSIITISRGPCSRGKEIAENVASRLGYECVAWDAVHDASEEFNVPEVKLIRAIHNAPSILERIGYRKEKYIAYVQAAILKRFSKDNIVYHGLGGHFFVRGIPHVLKVRILSDMVERIRLEMERDNVSREKAEKVLQKDDEERRKWSTYLYGVDTRDPTLYDLVIRLRKVTPEMAADMICETVKLEKFRTTEESQKALENLLLSAAVKAALAVRLPGADVSARDGEVCIMIRGEESQRSRIDREVGEVARRVPGVRSVRVGIRDQVIYSI